MKYSIVEINSSFIETGLGNVIVIDDRMNELVEGIESESDYSFWTDGDGFDWLKSVEETGGEWIGETFSVKVN